MSGTGRQCFFVFTCFSSFQRWPLSSLPKHGYSHSSTPYPRSFKCFTCEQASDNYSCNRWAEDKWCPQNTKYCMTIHHFGHHGKTKFVSKRCATLEDFTHTQTCILAHTNMHSHTLTRTCRYECVSCCEGMACNVELPTNHTNAVFVWSQAYGSAALGGGRWNYMLLIVSGLTALLVLCQ
uniref:LY6/PLAUR domain containing 6B n=1 Tax=Electrophorus electricus TaxID=8005 RepID=A0AAY5EFL2_ELEEL